MNLQSIIRAGAVRRWHSNPDLAHTVDRVDAHSARVAAIIMHLHPSPGLPLIRAALIHDHGEWATGDVSYEVKRKNPEFARLLDAAETQAREHLWGADPDLTQSDLDWLNFADRLDSFMWAKHHAPHVLTGDGWPEAFTWLQNMASKIGCRATVAGALGAGYVRPHRAGGAVTEKG